MMFAHKRARKRFIALNVAALILLIATPCCSGVGVKSSFSASPVQVQSLLSTYATMKNDPVFQATVTALKTAPLSSASLIAAMKSTPDLSVNGLSYSRVNDALSKGMNIELGIEHFTKSYANLEEAFKAQGYSDELTAEDIEQYVQVYGDIARDGFSAREWPGLLRAAHTAFFMGILAGNKSARGLALDINVNTPAVQTCMPQGGATISGPNWIKNLSQSKSEVDAAAACPQPITNYLIAYAKAYETVPNAPCDNRTNQGNICSIADTETSTDAQYPYTLSNTRTFECLKSPAQGTSAWTIRNSLQPTPQNGETTTTFPTKFLPGVQSSVTGTNVGTMPSATCWTPGGTP